MTDHDGRDPLRAAFLDYQRPPRDVVPASRRSVDDLAALAGTTVPVTHYELTAGGVRQYTERIEITKPITTPKETDQ